MVRQNFRLVMLVIGIILPGALFGTGVSWWLAVEIRAQTGRDAGRMADQVSGNIAEHIRLLTASMTVLAHSPSLERGDFAETYRFGRELADKLGLNVALATVDGTQIFNTRQPLGTELPRRNSIQSPVRAAAEQQANVSNIFTGALTGRSMVSIDVPFATRQGIYILATSTEVSEIGAILARTKLDSGWTAVVVDGTGRIIARTVDPEKWVGRLAVPEVVAIAGLARESGSQWLRSHEGTDLRSFYRKVPGTPWTVLVGTPDTVLHGPLTRPVFSLAAGGAAAIMLTVAVAVVLRRRLNAAIASARAELAAQQEERQRLESRAAEARRLEALGHLAGGVAHDFNNILGAILGFAGFIVEDSPPGSASYRFAERVVGATERGAALVRQILTFARKTQTELHCFDAAEAVGENGDLIRMGVPANIEIRQRLGPGNVIEADRGQFGQALMNLCFNARDAIGAGQGIITITVAPTDMTRTPMRRLAEQQGEEVETWLDGEGYAYTTLGALQAGSAYVSVTVADTGSGMDVGVQSRIFEPFFSTRSKGGDTGTGLGMSVVRGIVLSHGAAIVVRSRLGSGTEVDVIFRAGGSRDPVSSVAAPGAPPVTGQGRVLVVDDDTDLGEMLAAALGRRGYVPALFSNPLAALAAFGGGTDWDAMVVDQVMPGMHGIDLIRRVRSVRPGFPCILCTGFDGTLDEHLARDAGALALLHKPVDLDHLCEVLSKEISSAGAPNI